MCGALAARTRNASTTSREILVRCSDREGDIRQERVLA